MINPRSINQFLQEKLDLLNRRDCFQEFEKLEPPLETNLPPLNHQKSALVAALRRDGCLCLFLEMGLGKTKIALDLFRYLSLLHSWTSERMLVLVPNVVNLHSWDQEIRRHAEMELPRIEVRTYASLAWSLSTLVEKPRTFEDEKVVRKMKINPDQVRRKGRDYKLVVFDESTTIMNSKSLYFRLCRHLSQDIPHRICMTGTPFGRDLTSLWSQFFLVDRGVTLGKNLGLFRESFFTKKRNFWGGWDYTFKKSLLPQLRNRMRHSSITFQVEECYDLPERTYLEHQIPLPEQAKPYYQKCLESFRSFLNKDQEKASLSFNQLRQLCSGFLYLRDPSGRRQTIGFPNEKIRFLSTYLLNLAEQEPIIIFYEFLESEQQLVGMLRKSKIPFLLAAKDVGRWCAGESQVLLANMKSSGMGLNLQRSRRIFYYEPCSSSIIRQQSEGRIRRVGQKRPVFYHDLITEHSVEEKMVGYLREGKELFEAVIQGKTRI